MLLDRHRVIKLIELAELEARLTGPERMLREEDVALLVKAAYDDATDAARAEFLRQLTPTSAWPWSAVQAMTMRAGSRGSRSANVVGSPAPGALAPAALVLLRGQASGIDADPGNRVPDRNGPDGAAWEPLHKALDLWDTATIRKWSGPLGWTLGGVGAGQSERGAATPGGVSGSPGGADSPSGGVPDGGVPGGLADNASQPEPGPSPPPLSWRDPRVLAAGATVATTIGVTLYALRRRRAHPVPLAAPGAASPAAPSPAAPPADKEPT
jgi:hypothetical protein